MSLAVAVPVGVRVGALRLAVRLVSSGRGQAWRPAAAAGWVTGLGGGAAGWGVRRFVLCGAQGSWGAVGAVGVGAPTLLGWRGGVCVRGWALGDVPQADAVSLRRLEALSQAPEDIQVVLGRGEVAGVDSQGVERISQRSFSCACGIHPPHRLEAAVLHRPLAGPEDQALEGGSCPGPLSQVPELRAGPAAPPLSLGGAAVLGGGVGVGGCDWVLGTVLWGFSGSGCAGGCGLAGMRARSPPRGWVETRGGRGSGACAVCGLTSRVGRGLGTLLVDPDVDLLRSGAVRGPWGAGFERWQDEVRRVSAAARSAMKVVAAASVKVGGRRAGRCCLQAWDGWGRMS